MYVIKHVPEDFVVEEISTVRPQQQGKFTYFGLLKKDYTTLEALQRTAAALHLPFKHFSCAGNKDRRAVTTQICSVYGAPNLERLKLKDISVKSIGFGDEPIHIGQLEGNRFKITIRNLDKMPNFVPRFHNLFGEQRFSTKNADIGRHIVKREFEQAARTIAELFTNIPKLQDCIAKSDWIGALRSIPRKLLLLFVHSYQSLLWNKAASVSKAEKLPIVGFGTSVHDDVTKEILREESISPRDFVIKQLPEATAEGAERAVWAEAKDLKLGNLEDDELFPGKKKVIVEFFLPKGSYATEFIQQCCQ